MKNCIVVNTGRSRSYLLASTKVLENSKAELERHVSEEELRNALKGMECGKAPGIGAKPCWVLWRILGCVGEDLLAILNESLADRRWSCSRSHSYLKRVIYRRSRTGDLWVCYVLILKSFLRLWLILWGKVIGQVIHFDQTYCVPGRTTAGNVCLIRDVFRVFQGITSIDQENAFNREKHQKGTP